MLIQFKNLLSLISFYLDTFGCHYCIHVSFTFLVLIFRTFLVGFSGPPTPSCQKENHKIGPEMSRIGTRKVKETQKIVFQSRFLEMRPKYFLTRNARQKTISAYISRKLDQKYTIVYLAGKLSFPAKQTKKIFGGFLRKNSL